LLSGCNGLLPDGPFPFSRRASRCVYELGSCAPFRLRSSEGVGAGAGAAGVFRRRLVVDVGFAGLGSCVGGGASPTFAAAPPAFAAVSASSRLCCLSRAACRDSSGELVPLPAGDVKETPLPFLR